MVAAEKQNKRVGALRVAFRNRDSGLHGARSQAVLSTMSRALTTEKRVKSIVLPARSALDRDLAWSVASSTCVEASSGGSSNGPGLSALSWCRGFGYAPDACAKESAGGALFSRVKEKDAEIRAAANFVHNAATQKSNAWGEDLTQRSAVKTRALSGS